MTHNNDDPAPVVPLIHCDVYASLLDQLAAKDATIAQLTAALERAAKQFRFYETNHRAKPDHSKADTNAAFAEDMEATVRDAKPNCASVKL